MCCALLVCGLACLSFLSSVVLRIFVSLLSFSANALLSILFSFYSSCVQLYLLDVKFFKATFLRNFDSSWPQLRQPRCSNVQPIVFSESFFRTASLSLRPDNWCCSQIHDDLRRYHLLELNPWANSESTNKTQTRGIYKMYFHKKILTSNNFS